MTYKLPVTWEVYGFVKIEANSIEEAIEIFNRESDHIELPEDSEYVDGSFELSSDEPDYVMLFNK